MTRWWQEPRVAEYYAAARIALVTLSLVGLAVSGACPAWFILACAAVSAAVLARGATAGRIAPWATPVVRLVILFAGIALGVDAFLRTRDILFLFSHVIASLIPFTLGMKDRLDAHWLSMLSAFLGGLVGLVAGNGIADYLIFFAFAGTVVFYLNAGHLYHHMGPAEALTRRMPENYFLPFILSVAGGMWIGVALFVLFPRSLQWSNPFGLRSTEKTTGYSGKASLEGRGPTEDTTLAVMLETDEWGWLSAVGHLIYLRGNTLDAFDGVRWSNTLSKQVPFNDPAAVQYTRATAAGPRFLRIFREPHAATTVLYPGVLRQIDAPMTLLGGLRRDAAGNVSRVREGLMRYTYEVLVTPLSDESKLLPSAPLASWAADKRELARAPHAPAESVLDAYLAVPQSVRSAPYFRDWLREVGVDPARDGLAAAMEKLIGHFSTGYRAALAHEFSSPNQLEAFLTTDRRGHCQYFATAAALYLRTLGVPTRMVLGYRGGHFNPVSRVLEVRESDAHAWVEVLTPGAGWVTLDPTPSIPSLVGKEWYRPALQYLTAAKYWFERYVIDYNSATQIELFRDIARWGKSPAIRWSAIRGSPWWWAALVVALALGIRHWRVRRRFAGGKARLPDYYRVFEKRLAGQGVRKKASETFAQFHARLRGSDEPTVKLLRDIDLALERDLYARHPLPRYERDALEQRVRKTAISCQA